MLKTGLVSVTFRKSTIEQVVGYVKNAGLDGIEWGGDVHVPAGAIQTASETKELCDKNGIEIFSYGSYYRAANGQHFTDVAETAKALGAKNIRIWAGIFGSETTPDNRSAVTADIKRVCLKAKSRGISLSTEYHQNTLTDEAPSALLLAKDVADENFSLYWQPNQWRSFKENCEALKTVLPYLSGVHVFAWEGRKWLPLEKHKEMWREYINIIKSSGRDHNMMLEFVIDSSEKQFYSDAETLKELCE